MRNSIVRSQDNTPPTTRKPVNGFSQGINLMQILSYLTVLLMLLVFTFSLLPIFSLTLQIILSLLYYSSLIGMGVLAFWCTQFDPTDKMVIQSTIARLNGQDLHSSEMEYYCNSCVSFVQSSSKHCKSCNRCVADFDHHCKWLNNCVGRVNYKHFLCLICFVLANTIVFTISASLGLAKFYEADSSGTSSSLENQFYFRIGNSESGETTTISFWTIVLWIFAPISLIIAFLDTNLLAFHMYISKKNITTYDYIVQQRAVRQQKQLQRLEESSKKKDEEEKKRLHLDFKSTNNRNRNSIELGEIVDTQYNQNRADTLVSPSNNRLAMETLSSAKQQQLYNQQDSIGAVVVPQSQPSCSQQFKRFCCYFCLQSEKSKNRKVGVITAKSLEGDALHKADGKSDATGEDKKQKLDKFAVFNEMDRRGICHSTDLVENIQMTPVSVKLGHNEDSPRGQEIEEVAIQRFQDEDQQKDTYKGSTISLVQQGDLTKRNSKLDSRNDYLLPVQEESDKKEELNTGVNTNWNNNTLLETKTTDGFGVNTINI